MKRFIAIMLCASLLTVTVSACTTDNGSSSKATIEYNKIDVSEAPEKVQQLIENNKAKKGYIYYEENGISYIGVMAGEKNTGGYSVEIISLTKNTSNELTLTVRFNSPGKNDIVTQAFTYPYALISFSTGNIKAINVVDEKTGKLDKLN